MSSRTIRGTVEFKINGVTFKAEEVAFTWKAAAPDPLLPIRWAGWFDRIWEEAGRRRDLATVGMPLAAVRLGHRRMARGELEPFPRPFA